LACAHTLGRRIRSAEAFVGDEVAEEVSIDTASGQPAPATTDSEAIQQFEVARPVEVVQPVNVVAEEALSVNDADLLEFDATAYCIPGFTAAGIATRKGTIAADPRILPLGSVVHIRAGEYSGTYMVLDTGARIKGRKIDIYMPNRREAMSFGRRPVRLKILGRVHPRHLQPK